MSNPTPIIPRKSFIELIEEMNLDDFATIHFKCLKYVSGNISMTELFYLVMTVRLFKPAMIMEFGTYNGRSTLNMAINTEGTITTVDLPRSKKLRTSYPLAREKDLDESGYVGLKHKLWQGQDKEITSRIVQVWQDTAKLKFERYMNKYGFIFIDASHTKDNCKNDSYNAHKMKTRHGIIYWHDYNGWPGVTEALNEYYEEEGRPEKMYWFNDTSLVGRFF